MRPLSEHTGRGVVLNRADVDTDQIIPADHCKKMTKSGYEDGLFGRWREDPGFVLNDPRHADATVLVASHNFGTGSSREHAVWALRDWGFKAVLATSFGDIFRRNSWKNGLMAVQLPEDLLTEIAARVAADGDFDITIDLAAQELRAAELRHEFTVDPRARWLLMNGLDDIGVTMEKGEIISAYENDRPRWLPQVRRTKVMPMQPVSV
jgi:3-isopropylmalate/(R)-2-methylmalate dehydratase small subunit